jgi:hypothetical protein
MLNLLFHLDGLELNWGVLSLCIMKILLSLTHFLYLIYETFYRLSWTHLLSLWFINLFQYFLSNFLFPMTEVFYMASYLLIDMVFIRLWSPLRHFYFCSHLLRFRFPFFTSKLIYKYFSWRRQYSSILFLFKRSELIFSRAVTLASSYLTCYLSPFFSRNQISSFKDWLWYCF